MLFSEPLVSPLLSTHHTVTAWQRGVVTEINHPPSHYVYQRFGSSNTITTYKWRIPRHNLAMLYNQTHFLHSYISPLPSPPHLVERGQHARPLWPCSSQYGARHCSAQHCRQLCLIHLPEGLGGQGGMERGSEGDGRRTMRKHLCAERTAVGLLTAITSTDLLVNQLLIWITHRWRSKGATRGECTQDS